MTTEYRPHQAPDVALVRHAIDGAMIGEPGQHMAHVQLDGLLEQQEAIREAVSTAYRATRQPIDLNYVALLKDDWDTIVALTSNPAISLRPTMPLGSSGRSDISARADDGHYCIGPDCPDCAPASRSDDA